MKTQGRGPVSITLDGYAASYRAVRELPEQNSRWKDTRLRSSKYLDNRIEQNHRNVKSRIKPMLGFKIFDRAAVTIAGTELLHRIRKGQFKRSRHQCTVGRSRPCRCWPTFERQTAAWLHGLRVTTAKEPSRCHQIRRNRRCGCARRCIDFFS
ncbi:DDE-type integrase/transposase/recombinase [Variovorax sp. M-6]